MVKLSCSTLGSLIKLYTWLQGPTKKKKNDIFCYYFNTIICFEFNWGPKYITSKSKYLDWSSCIAFFSFQIEKFGMKYPIMPPFMDYIYIYIYVCIYIFVARRMERGRKVKGSKEVMVIFLCILIWDTQMPQKIYSFFFGVRGICEWKFFFI